MQKSLLPLRDDINNTSASIGVLSRSFGLSDLVKTESPSYKGGQCRKGFLSYRPPINPQSF